MKHLKKTKENGNMRSTREVFTMALTSIVAFAACQQEMVDFYESNNDIQKVYASIEESSETKTTLNDKEVLWSSGDQIAVFIKNTLRKRFDITSESVGSKKGTFLYDSDYLVTGNNSQISNNIAYYPFSDVICTPNGDSYAIDNVTLPEIQSYVPESFSEESFPMVAVTKDVEDVDFAFRNVCGVLAFQLKGSGVVKSITVKGNSDEILAGKAGITASYGKYPEIVLHSDGSKVVTLDCGESGVELQKEASTSFFICLPPISFENGFTITVTDISGGREEYATTKENAVLRSGILRMPVKDYVREKEPQEGDYVDEYGINHGPGVEIDGVVWAPVNCGYHATDFKYGKLYQWGRKYGQGYGKGNGYDGTYNVNQSGPVSLNKGQSNNNSDVFYKCQEYPFNWLSNGEYKLWNLGTESNPIKTEYDPCPEGWRVPTNTELCAIRLNYSSWATNELGQKGYYMSGSNLYVTEVPNVFFSAAGYRYTCDGTCYSRDAEGLYWSSSTNLPESNYFYFRSNMTLMSQDYPGRGCSVRCVQDNSDLIPVEIIGLSKTFLTLPEGSSEVLSATIVPSNANHQTPFWWSDNPSVATVDSNGNVSAVSEGTTIITAMAGMQVATCEVTIKSAISESKDYVDEYGINHGKGVKIGETVWAPVNCGYHATDFKYGKLYQWGRKYGQGYEGGLYDGDWNYIGYYSDASVPEIVRGPVSLVTGQSKANANKFYDTSSDTWHWCSYQDDKLWNSGTEKNPVKTEYDPCPNGWRVPTYAELEELQQNYSSWISEDGQDGYWFTGPNPYSESLPQVFFPAAGRRDDGGLAQNRGYNGHYWSSRPNGYPFLLYFDLSSTCMNSDYHANGYSVRCVQATDEVAEL